jgi:hypothetical protein
MSAAFDGCQPKLISVNALLEGVRAKVRRPHGAQVR